MGSSTAKYPGGAPDFVPQIRDSSGVFKPLYVPPVALSNAAGIVKLCDTAEVSYSAAGASNFSAGQNNYFYAATPYALYNVKNNALDKTIDSLQTVSGPVDFSKTVTVASGEYFIGNLSGSATTAGAADKLLTGTTGGPTQFIYFADGKPTTPTSSSYIMGSPNQGIYLNSTGTFSVMSKTVEANVPNNAVFTDTWYDYKLSMIDEDHIGLYKYASNSTSSSGYLSLYTVSGGGMTLSQKALLDNNYSSWNGIYGCRLSNNTIVIDKFLQPPVAGTTTYYGGYVINSVVSGYALFSRYSTTGIFNRLGSLSSINAVYFNTSVSLPTIGMSCLFKGMNNLRQICGFSNITIQSTAFTMFEAFYGCYKLRDIPFSELNFSASQVQTNNLDKAFYSCSALESLDLTWMVHKSNTCNSTFANCISLHTIKTYINSWSKISTTNASSCFYRCPKLLGEEFGYVRSNNYNTSSYFAATGSYGVFTLLNQGNRNTYTETVTVTSSSWKPISELSVLSVPDGVNYYNLTIAERFPYALGIDVIASPAFDSLETIENYAEYCIQPIPQSLISQVYNNMISSPEDNAPLHGLFCYSDNPPDTDLKFTCQVTRSNLQSY